MALQRLRVGPVNGPTLLGVLAAAVLIAALVVTGRSQQLAGGRPLPSVSSTDPAQAPYRVGGGYRCPLGRPVLAMADGHSYPPGHPTRPPGTPGPSPVTRPLPRRRPPATDRRRRQAARW